MPTSTSAPELHHVPTNSVAVFASKYRHADIVDAIDRQSDGREAGGFLFGRIIEDDRVEIVGHSAAHRDAHRTRGSIELDLAAAVQHRDDAEIGGEVLGDYHSHPGGNAEPSAVDRTAALRSMDALGSPLFVSLILTMRNSGAWDVASWVTRRNEQGQAITEPATLLVQGDS